MEPVYTIYVAHSDASIFISKEDFSSLKEGISSSKMVHRNSGGLHTKAMPIAVDARTSRQVVASEPNRSPMSQLLRNSCAKCKGIL